ncbi:MAG: ParA family protein [Thermoanaerobaculia bacterium]|nr:ParA family protein [Thermoanaerobaculia bacterium]
MLVDVPSNLGGLSRAALINAKWLIVQLAPDVFALRGLESLGAALQRWNQEWAVRRQGNPVAELALSPGATIPAGYVLMQPAVRLDRPPDKHDHLLRRIPAVYRQKVLGGDFDPALIESYEAAHRLASLQHYVSLASLAQEARKPMFFLKPADGALGAHAQAVVACYRDFKGLVENIDKKVRFLGSDPTG